jgi:hypothetical protein
VLVNATVNDFTDRLQRIEIIHKQRLYKIILKLLCEKYKMKKREISLTPHQIKPL